MTYMKTKNEAMTFRSWLFLSKDPVRLASEAKK